MAKRMKERRSRSSRRRRITALKSSPGMFRRTASRLIRLDTSDVRDGRTGMERVAVRQVCGILPIRYFDLQRGLLILKLFSAHVSRDKRLENSEEGRVTRLPLAT